jgi:hypothetical protein
MKPTIDQSYRPKYVEWMLKPARISDTKEVTVQGRNEECGPV